MQSYKLPAPIDVRHERIHGQMCEVLVYPTGARHKALMAFPEALDGTSEANLSPRGRKLLTSHFATRALHGNFASPGRLRGVTINGRMYSGGHYRQSAYEAPLAPVRASDGFFAGYGAGQDFIVTTPFRLDDDVMATLFGRCAAIASHSWTVDHLGQTISMRSSYADGTHVAYHHKPELDRYSGRNFRPTRLIVNEEEPVQVKASGRWVNRLNLPATYFQARMSPLIYAPAKLKQRTRAKSEPVVGGYIWRKRYCKDAPEPTQPGEHYQGTLAKGVRTTQPGTW